MQHAATVTGIAAAAVTRGGSTASPGQGGPARPATTAQGRLHLLDAMRGVAAIAVVFFHWQHFQLIDGAAVDRQAQPFFPVLRILYEQGWMAVDLFFCLSGFVFFWLYAAPIAAQRVGVGSFARLRLSRLYPLHLATLIVVAALQPIFAGLAGHPFVYRCNDTYHFAAQALFVADWGVTSCASFNGPTWSISVEVLLYLLFFLLCRIGVLRPAWVLALLVVAGIGMSKFHADIGRGLIGFFMGGLVHRAWMAALPSPRAPALAAAASVLACLGWCAALLEFHAGTMDQGMRWLLAHVAGGPSLSSAWASKSGYIRVLLVTVGLFPLTVLAAALHEATSRRDYRRLGPLGDISYSSYLLHFPLQLGFAILAAAGFASAAFLRSATFLLPFLALLIMLSWLSYAWFERPMQHWLRGPSRRQAA